MKRKTPFAELAKGAKRLGQDQPSWGVLGFLRRLLGLRRRFFAGSAGASPWGRGCFGSLLSALGAGAAWAGFSFFSWAAGWSEGFLLLRERAGFSAGVSGLGSFAAGSSTSDSSL